jgi:hypothetical protein
MPRLSMLLVALAVTACGEPYDFHQPEHPDVMVAVCDAGLLEAVERGAAQWTRATGIQIGVELADTGAVSVRWGDSGGIGAGSEDPKNGEIEIQRALEDDSYLDRIVAHELGHALESPEQNHIPPDASGLMTGSTIWDPRITAADLELICCGIAPLVPCVALRSE